MTITIDNLESLWGHKVNTTQLRTVCADLKSKTYEIPIHNENGKLTAYHYRGLFSKINYEIDQKFITFQFDEDMHEHLLSFTNRFCKYNIENILSFKSKYSISFYERFKYDDFKKEPMKVEILELVYIRDWLNLKTKYTRVNDFKIKVLDKVSQDLKKHSDIYMDFEFIKSGRKVTHIKFTYGKNLSKPQREASFFDDDELDIEYSKYLNKPFILDGNLLEIKVLTPMSDFYVATYTNERSGKIFDLKKLDSLIRNYRG
jgi:plasmid replication initiation protein